MKKYFQAIKELSLRGFRILTSYGVLYLLLRVWKYLKRQGWRNILAAGDLNVQYQKWLARKNKQNVDMTQHIMDKSGEAISILMPVYNPKKFHLEEAVQSILSQTSPNWQLCIADDGSSDPDIKDYLESLAELDPRISVLRHGVNQGISEATNTALKMAKAKYVLFMDQDDILMPHAISSFQKLLSEQDSPDLIYADEDKYDEFSRKRIDPHFKPGWSPHLLHSYNYIGHPVVVRRQLVEQVGGLRKAFDGAQDHDLLLRLSELPLKVIRIPDVLYSWRIIAGSTADGWEAKPQAAVAGCEAVRESLQRKGYPAQVTHTELGIYNYRIQIVSKNKVSIIIPTKDNYKMLKRCLDSIWANSSYINYEVIVIDNGSTSEQTLTFLESIRKLRNFKVLSYPDDFNYPLINNFGASNAAGDHYVFLNDDTEVLSSDWLEALLEHSQMPEVGAVGALLIFPNGLIQHAGIVIGMRGSASHAFYKCDAKSPGYFNLVQCVRDVSAVTAACMMIKAGTFTKAGGFNPVFRLGLNDVDLCLRLLNMGLYNVYTPHARLVHHESQTRGEYIEDKEIELFRSIYNEIISNGDLYYHPELSLERNDYSLAV